MKKLFLKSVFLLASFVLSFNIYSQNNVNDKIKAAFLYQFTQHINWDGSKIDSNTVTIKVIGNDEIVTELKSIILKNKLTAKIKVVNSENDSKYQILFVTGKLNSTIKKSVNLASENNVLIVTDISKLTNADVHISDSNSLFSLVLNSNQMKNKSFKPSEKLVSVSIVK